jgi:hypothetical protein
MRTYPLKDSGALRGFEVSNAWLHTRAIARFVSSIGAQVRFQRRLFGAGDVHLKFQYKGREFQVVEPFGDNSRYWIVPVEASPSGEVADLHDAFVRYRPGLVEMFRSLFDA